MATTKRLRRWISGGVAMAMLFMQLATAAYACPILEKAVELAAMAAMPDCHGMALGAMDGEQPQLCKAHCDQGRQSTASTPVPDLQANPAAVILLQGIVEPAPLPMLALLASSHSPWLSKPGGAPPLYLSLLVLRN
ncbi:MAG: hypothetical protein IV097_01925 [Burkholderiaceae bacterium]|nr:hypothetical protein [Burkholderiaceae bacterium]